MRVLGIDVGDRRIGLALSDPSAMLARPWQTLHDLVSTEVALDRVAACIQALEAEEDGLGRIVVGLPSRLDGRPGPQTDSVRAFAQALGVRTRLPIVFEDERLTSREAERRLALRERDWRKRKQRLDAAAAAIILQDHLDRSGSTSIERDG